MRIPVRPPPLENLIREIAELSPSERVFELVFGGAIGPEPRGKYRHWDNFRHLPTDDGVAPEYHWAAVKIARRPLLRTLPFTDVHGRPFQAGLPPAALEMLHHVDRDASGVIGAPEPVTNAETQATYLLKSIVEEAIKSSQLEGASTTRRVAKDMLISGREPRNRSERMIVNNYEALQYVRQHKLEQITPSRVLKLQAILTQGTLDDPSAAGRFRRDDENIVVEDETGVLLHRPPTEAELPERLRRLCAFANGGAGREFMHPVVRAILVHFALAYDHPFVDGNGRTARALFYWVMAREGYWLCEYVSISRILKKARAQYARSFLYTETDDNDATYFVLYQLRVLTRAIAELHTYLTRKAGEIREVDDLVHQSRNVHANLNSRQLDLLSHALKHPGAEYTIRSHQRAHEVAYATSRSDLLALAQAKLLTQRKRGRLFVYVAPPDLRARLTRS
jgi:Fic family protein